MSKQDKVLKKIQHSIDSGKTTPRGTKPNDECYTSMQDILNELSYWGALGKFQGKNIVCPCDWDIVEDNNVYSITITYTEEGIDAQSRTHVAYDLWANTLWSSSEINSEPRIEHIDLKEEEVDEFLRNKLTCNFIRILAQNARRWGISSITASGYDPDTGRGIKFQDINYEEYDVCITNPPFSLYGEFMKCIVGKIDFICLAPFLNRVNPNVGLPLMLKQAYLGHNVYLALNFYNPTSDNEYKNKAVACDWITSYPEAQGARNKEKHNHRSGVCYADYKDDYIVMENMTMKDGTHPIRVPATMLPDDYFGWMFTSVNVLHEIDLSQFEWYGTSFKKYYNKTCVENNPFQHACTDNMVSTASKKFFHGVLLKRINTDK